MRRLGIVFVILISLNIAGCTVSSSSTTKDLNLRISELQREIDDLNSELEVYKLQEKNFATVTNKTLDFVRAMTIGDAIVLENLLSSEIQIIERDSEIYAKNDYEWLLYCPSDNFKDMVIQGFGYNKETDTYIIHTRLFYLDDEGNDISPPIFLTLIFKPHIWEIVDLYFDV